MEEYDVFISYAHLDNMPLRPEEPDSGWVSKFYYVLNNLLTQWLGRKARIFRDTRDIDSNSYIWPTIEENLKKSNTFVPVVSPSYLNSEWCPKELRTYRKLDNSARIGSKSRIFKVFKQPVNNNQIALDLRDLFTEVLATNFFEEDRNSGKTRSFNVAYGEKWEQSFYQKIDFLAQEIAELLGEAQPILPAAPAEHSESAALAPFLGTVIYLTEPSPDLWKDYLEIRRDFIKRGATVFPLLDSLKPDTIEEYEAATREELKQCKLVVHFIGSEDVAYSETDSSSLIRLQTEIAAKYQDESGYTRLILVPPTIAPATEDYRRFVETLWETTSRSVDLLRTPLELKTEMERVLTGKPKPEAVTVADESIPTVYILHEAQDFEAANRLADKLFENGCEVWMVSHETPDVDLIEAHKYYLTNCDAALVFWDKAPMFRVRAMMSDFQRIMDNGRERPFRAKGVMIEGDSFEKKTFRTHETLIRGEADFSGFIDRLKNGGQDR